MRSWLFGRNTDAQPERSPETGQMWVRHAEACLKEGDRGRAARAYARAAEVLLNEGHGRRARAAMNLARQAGYVDPALEAALQAVLEPPKFDPFASVSTPVETPKPEEATIRVTTVIDLAELRARRARQARSPRSAYSEVVHQDPYGVTEVEIDVEALESVGGSFA